MLSAALADRGVGHAPSDKGLLACGIRTLVSDSNILRDSVTLRVIDALTTHRFEYELKEAKKQFPDQVPEALAAMATRMQEIRQTSRTLIQVREELRQGGMQVTRHQVGTVLTRLVNTGAAIRGFMVSCTSCGMSTFVDVSQLEAPPTCPGCGSYAALVSAHDGEPAQHYRLNGMVDRASDQGVLPHVVAAAALCQKGQHPEAYVSPGTNCTLPDGTKAEADVLALVGRDLWLGEAKSRSDGFTDEQLEKDLALTLAVGASTYLMICLDGIDAGCLQRACARATMSGVQLLTLTTADGVPTTI